MTENRFIDTTYGSMTYGNQQGFPAVKNYTFNENLDLRSKFDSTFRWEDVYTEGREEDGLDFVLPKGYFLQFSPDLGYKNVMEHFIYKGDIGGNSLLRESTILTFENGALEDAENNSVKTTLSQAEFRSLLHNAPYQRYFWRAIPVYDDGSHGIGGYPAKFYYKKIVENEEWSISETPETTYNTSFSLRGNKTENITEIEINDSSQGVYYPDKTKWAYQAILSPGENKFLIRAKDKRNNWSSYREVIVTFVDNIPVQSNIWNTFDEFATLMGVKRLPGENNENLRKRIKDVVRNNGGVQYLGVLLSAIRALDSNFIEDGLKVRLKEENSFDESLPIVVVKSHGIIISGDSFFVPKEVHKVDPVSLKVFFKKPFSSLSRLNLSIGREEETDGKDYKIDLDTNSIQFLSDRFANEYIHLSYYYEEYISWNQYPKVKAVRNALNSVKYPSGEYVFEAEISKRLSGNETSKGIILTALSSVDINSVNLGWSEIWFREMNDSEWRDSFLNENNNFFGTEWIKYVQKVLSITKDSWGLAVADLNTWDASVQGESASAFIPRKFDSRFGFWKTSNGNLFSSSQASFLNYRDPETDSKIIWSGVPRLKSGIGYDSDLTTKVYSRGPLQNRSLSDVKIIVSGKTDRNFSVPNLRANF